MSALLNYLRESSLVSDHAEDDEAAVRELQNSISEMLLATARHRAGSGATSRLPAFRTMISKTSFSPLRSNHPSLS
jgi:hypothetical protein